MERKSFNIGSLFYVVAFIEAVLCILKVTGVLKDWPISAVIWPICAYIVIYAILFICGVFLIIKRGSK